MPVLAACHLIYICSVVLHYIAIHVVANKVLSLTLTNHQIYNSCAVGKKMNWIDFEVKGLTSRSRRNQTWSTVHH